MHIPSRICLPAPHPGSLFLIQCNSLNAPPPIFLSITIHRSFYFSQSLPIQVLMENENKSRIQNQECSFNSSTRLASAGQWERHTANMPARTVAPSLTQEARQRLKKQGGSPGTGSLARQRFLRVMGWRAKEKEWEIKTGSQVQWTWSCDWATTTGGLGFPIYKIRW